MSKLLFCTFLLMYIDHRTVCGWDVKVTAFTEWCSSNSVCVCVCMCVCVCVCVCVLPNLKVIKLNRFFFPKVAKDFSV